MGYWKKGLDHVIHIAVVGTGPAGFYGAQALLKSGLDIEVDLIERLPTPFGLVRSGVAPDHQHTKRVERAYARTARHPQVGFYGNIEVGSDLTLDELRALYDAVVLAVGAPHDRRLGLPGEDRANVYGSGAFVGWYNGHPDYQDLNPDLNVETAVVIGNGNVALDIARVLVKTPVEMAASDLPQPAARRIQESPLEEVIVLGRRGPAQAKFSSAELAEMGQLADAAVQVVPGAVPEAPPAGLDDRTARTVARNLELFREFAGADKTGARRRVTFRFWARPEAILGESRVTGLRIGETALDAAGCVTDTGRGEDISCGLVVTAIGYAAPKLGDLPFDPRGGHYRHEDGRIAHGLYCVGWCRRGPSGTIGTNKADGDAVARHIAAEVRDTGKRGGAGLEALLAERGLRWVNAADWETIDKAERAAAPPGAPRRKFLRVRDMLTLLDRDARPAKEG